MPPKPPKLELPPRSLAWLHEVARQRSAEHRRVQRAQLILALASADAGNTALARSHQWVRDSVSKWRSRWLALAPTLAQAEADQVTDADLHAWLQAGLDDLPRSGAPPTFTPEQVVSIVALACQEPALSGLPFTHWTPQALADEAHKRGYVTSISATQVWRFLKSGAVTTASRGGLAAPRTG